MTEASAPGVPVELTIVTGLSGAGRSTAAKYLEDLGWFVVDNLPPLLLPAMAALAEDEEHAIRRVAVVVDVRGGGFFADLRAALNRLDRGRVVPRVLFLEASEETLVRRFENVRRPHPLQGGDRLVDGIERERALLQDLRGEADLVVDTSSLNVHELRRTIGEAFGGEQHTALRATVVSFGFKYGLPVDADLVVDCRFLPNPHWVEELRPRTGLDAAVRAYVLEQDGAQALLDAYSAVLDTVTPGYLREGKHFLTLAVGCTGGKHRSVVMAEQLGQRLAATGVPARVVHRDLGRE
jgi:UPF0042 nucleotide-binding protein